MYTDEELTKALVGKTIRGISVNEDQSLMVFNTDQGDVAIQAKGDCCSESWFSDFLGVDALLNQCVRKLEGIPLPSYNTEDGRGRQDVDAVYGFRFTTPRGYGDLIFRNSSNGWYGGRIDVLPPEDYKEYLEEDYPETILTPITEDWMA